MVLVLGLSWNSFKVDSVASNIFVGGKHCSLKWHLFRLHKCTMQSPWIVLGLCSFHNCCIEERWQRCVNVSSPKLGGTRYKLANRSHYSKIRELNDGNKNWKQIQTNQTNVGPTNFELWVMETELWVMENSKSKQPLYLTHLWHIFLLKISTHYLYLKISHTSLFQFFCTYFHIISPFILCPWLYDWIGLHCGTKSKIMFY